MDQWLLHATEEQRTWLTQVLQNADQNPWRKAWRTALVENNETELARIFRGEEIAHQSSRSTLNASYSVRHLIPFEERLLALQRLRVRHVNDVWINLRLGRVLLGKGRKQDALTYYQAALAAHPTAAVHGVIANLVQERAQYHEAVAHWREATRLKPDISAYYFCLGENLMYAYRYDEAIAGIRARDGSFDVGL